MDDFKRSKIDRFLGDPLMVDVVFEKIRESFLKKKPVRPIEVMAAERIAIDLLVEAKIEIERERPEAKQQNGGITQVGL